MYCCSGPFTFDSSMAARCKRFGSKHTCPATWLVSNLFPRVIFYSVALNSTHTVPGGLHIPTTLLEDRQRSVSSRRSNPIIYGHFTDLHLKPLSPQKAYSRLTWTRAAPQTAADSNSGDLNEKVWRQCVNIHGKQVTEAGATRRFASKIYRLSRSQSRCMLCTWHDLVPVSLCWVLGATGF